MRIKETKVYKYEELSDKAKERAREWFSRDYPDYDWWDFLYEDVDTIATSLGFDLDVNKKNPCIWFSGFCSQGDGACFEGIYRAENSNSQKFYEHVGKTESNRSIIDIAESFFLFAQSHPTFYGKLSHRGRYYHEFSVSYECYEEVETEEGIEDKMTVEIEEEFANLCRSFMKWIYNQLKKEHDYLTSDEQIEESIIINELEFTEDGKIA